ncbi:MAG: RluA family pseudouridine synthase [Oscillospiraceae bacterium]|nr:RluA family pseudouridine synthase [Oscillospiraceae bacterium]
MKEIIIGKNDSGQRLDRFLTKAFPLTIGVIMKAVRCKNIKVNGKRTEAAYKLQEGDILKIYIPVTPNANRPHENISTDLNIIYEDDNILLVDKPVGLLCHDGEDSLIDRIKAYLGYNDSYTFEPALCNRIDRNTGGIVIAAKTAEALRILNEKIRNREIKKLYLCILTGIPKEKQATLTAYLEKDSENNTVTISNRKTPHNKTIVTKYRVISSKNNLALAEIDLITGRTHQIRAHMAYIGHPLLGDGKYGRNKINKPHGMDKQALYSYKIVFEFKEKSPLDYLNGKSFEVKDIWFMKEGIV